MKLLNSLPAKRLLVESLSMFVLVLSAYSVKAEGYQALKGVQQVKAVFDVSLESPTVAPIVFWAVKNVYEDSSVRNLPHPPEVAVVFHGPAVKLITTDRDEFTEKENKALDNFTGMLRQMKKDGVKLEVCMYAVNMLGIDPSILLPEIDQVPNGFVSVAGYQAQGYSVITIP